MLSNSFGFCLLLIRPRITLLFFSWTLAHLKTTITSQTFLYMQISSWTKTLLVFCRIWIRTRGRCCPSSTVFTASSAAVSPSEWWWWTTCCRAPLRCTTSMTWRGPRTNAEHHARSASSPRPRSKTWTSRRCMRACTLTQTPTAPWWRPCRGTVGWVHIKIYIS